MTSKPSGQSGQLANYGRFVQTKGEAFHTRILRGRISGEIPL